MSSLSYRPEIDGLRSVAVLPVIAFHAGWSVLGGGYAGVDIFFVISGYLITGILLRDLAMGRFSILRFYERRARRILPALVCVILACLPLAWIWMTPDQLEEFGRSILSVAGFVSNHFFWAEIDYFDNRAELKPLLHTWSLAVEEQYYVFFPPLLWLIWRLGRRGAFGVIVILTLGSLLMCHVGAERRPAMTFYLLPFRAWELGIGAICAFVLHRQLDGRGPAILSAGLGWLGLGMILGSMVFFEATTPWPSAWTILPVMGTALVILCARSGLGAGRLLSLRPLVGVGLISYSAYLWHQPLLAFARIRSLNDPTPLLMGGIVALTLVLAWLTWRFVEQPFRKGPRPLLSGLAPALGTAVAALVLIASTGAILWKADGAPGRLTPRETKIMAFPKDSALFDGCMASRMAQVKPHPQAGCLTGSGTVPDVVIAGDSHAFPLAQAVADSLTSENLTIYATSHTGCVPIPSLEARTGIDSASCHAWSAELYRYLDRLDDPVLVLSARWQAYLEQAAFDNGEGGHETGRSFTVDVTDFAARTGGEAERVARVKASYRAELLSLLERYRVVLVYPVPEAGWDVPLRAWKRARFHDDPVQEMSTSAAVFHQRSDPVMTLFDGIEHPNLFRVRPHERLCDAQRPGRCVNVLEGVLLYKDDDHLSEAGEALLRDELLQTVQKALAAPIP